MADTGSPGSGDADEATERAAQVAAARRRFAELAALPEAQVDVAEGALLIAAEEYPGLDVPEYLARLDALGARVRRYLAAPPGAAPAPPDADEAALHALHTVLFQEEGFTGAPQADYDEPRHCFLNDVLERKRGLPIALSVVYCAVARRAGLEAVGIALPGRFIAEFRGRHLSVLVDPYQDGARVTREDCAALVRGIYGPEAVLTPEHFLPASPKAILARILNNLKTRYFQRGQLTKALAAVERILMLQPSLDQVRDRGLILRQMGLLLLGLSGQGGRAGRSSRAAQPAPDDAPPDRADLLAAMQFVSAAWFDLQLYAREAEGQADVPAVKAAADALWRRMGKQN